MNTKTILFVVNPISGRSDKKGLIEKTKTFIALNGYEPVVYKTSGHEDQKEIKKLIRQYKPERLVVAGGDGTVQMVASSLGNETPCLGILPSGSANGLAKNLHLPDGIDEQLKVALGRSTIQIDSLKVDGKDCLHIADLGLNAQLIKNYETSNIRGKIGYLMQSVPTLFQTDYPFEFEVEANGKNHHGEGILLAIANARQFGTGATINPKGKLNDGKFEIILFKHLDPKEILKTLTDQKEINKEFAESMSTTYARIKAKKPVPLQIDGEYIGQVNDFEVEVYPRKLTIAVPEGFEP
ncbi:diacylglycerol/lipid kinase family protein [Pareuzebyella sediminis]|uniref:diacylglycerol/lipid kinase family protein n=1 Tax=Pareuzebyella sediminis TaxID=2607998 RepID=UPI0011EC7647|nr:diacylglycerol kinase family protein [Pareuzebyella sediminis]